MDISWYQRIDQQVRRWERYAELARGKLFVMRGVKAGQNFGVGRHVHVVGAYCLSVGDFVTIQEHSYLNCLSPRGVSIGDHSSIDRNLWLHCGGRPDKESSGYFSLGSNSYIGCNAVIGAGGGIRIGNNVLLGQSVNIHAENHNFRDSTRMIREQGVTYKGIVIEDDVWIGSKVTILDGVTIGKGSVVGAGSVVTHSIPPYTIAVGVPARVIGMRGEKKS